nr:MAG: amidohydrolase [Bacteroidota bacterium]
MRIFVANTIWIAVGALLVLTTAVAQDKELAPVSDTYAIRNLTIIPAPGRRIEKGTIIIQNGLIEAVGENVPIPPKAIIIEGDSLFAYPAFIEGLSKTGVKSPGEEEPGRIEDPGNPPPSRAGINPQRDVRDYLDPNDPTIKELRCAGFGASQVVPRGILLPGSAAVILLGGKTSDELVLKPRSACYSELTSNRTVYPSTVMAVLAKWRELYRQAELARDYAALYATNASGLPRPEANRTLEALYPVTTRQQPVLFRASKMLDIQRVLSLQKELGFVLILADVSEGWDLTEMIKASGARVFLSLDLPEDPAEEEKAKADSLSNPELKALVKRRSEFIQKMTAQAAAFDSAGIKFGFSAMDTKYSELHKNLRRMVEAGLNPESALAALTINAAQILGVDDRLGTIEKGKIANVALFNKPMFDKDAKVMTMFVDGALYTCFEKDAHKKSA